jgi:transposase-like protein
LGVGNGKKKDEYDRIYNYDREDSRNYEELSENDDPEDVIEKLKGTIGRGDCLFCNAKNAMEYEGNICFICSKCGKSVHEELYYRWAAGYDLDLED